MPTLGRLPFDDLARRLRSPVGVVLQTGPFRFRVRSPHALVAEGLHTLYAANRVEPDDAFADFAVLVDHGRALRRWVRPQARFVFDGQPVFEPLPADQAYPLLEWAMNWCISSHAHEFLVLHAAVVERDSCAMILPAPPGSGKSTLCAALVHSGWRLLSDELTLVEPASGLVWPVCRPVSLKNRSIEVIRAFAPQAVFNRVTHDTLKGSVTHMQAPEAHLRLIEVPGRPRWIVYPRYAEGAATRLQPRARASAMVDLARNAFNFAALGETGFDTLARLVQACACLDFEYSRLDEAMALFDLLARGATAAPAALPRQTEAV